jgi:hypothetical protein
MLVLVMVLVQHQKASIANALRRLRAENLAIVEAGDEII